MSTAHTAPRFPVGSRVIVSWMGHDRPGTVAGETYADALPTGAYFTPVRLDDEDWTTRNVDTRVIRTEPADALPDADTIAAVGLDTRDARDGVVTWSDVDAARRADVHAARMADPSSPEYAAAYGEDYVHDTAPACFLAYGPADVRRPVYPPVHP